MREAFIKKVREDERFGRGTCSVIDECWTDKDLARFLDDKSAPWLTGDEAFIEAFQCIVVHHEVFEDRMADARNSEF